MGRVRGVSGDRVTLRNNVITNVRFGIAVDGPNAVVQGNQIVNFSADGIRGLGDYGVYEYNLVKNVFVDDAAGDSNHDDGFQSWSVGPNGPGDGVVTGVVLRGNVFVNRDDPNQKHPNSMQGIGCFDGMFEDWVVENNVVITDHWHGISFYGMRNSRIVNNTVIDVNDVDPGPPWIMVTAHKNGTASENVVVRNNLATDFSLEGIQVLDDHNTTLTQLSTFFVDPAGLDLHLLPNAPAVDMGSSALAPALDADRIARPQGRGVDLGAYEWHDGSVLPVSGGAAAGGGVGRGGVSASIGGSGGTNSNQPVAGTNPITQNASSHDDEKGCGCRLAPTRRLLPTRHLGAVGIGGLVLLSSMRCRRRLERRCKPRPHSRERRVALGHPTSRVSCAPRQ